MDITGVADAFGVAVAHGPRQASFSLATTSVYKAKSIYVGGLVEFATRSSENPSNPSVITRTLKDTLNGIGITPQFPADKAGDPNMSTLAPQLPTQDESDPMKVSNAESDTPLVGQPTPRIALPPRMFDAQGRPIMETYSTDSTLVPNGNASSPGNSSPPTSAGLWSPEPG